MILKEKGEFILVIAMKMENAYIPLDVPKKIKPVFLKNYSKITKNSGRLMLFAGDQKIEHLNADFFGENIHPDDADPEHLFRIASRGKIGVFAAQLGLIARYGMDYGKIPYLVKLNSKTNIVPTSQKDPQSECLVDVEQVAGFKKESGLDILGVGYTLYLGSEYESALLREAAQVIHNAHKNGLVAVIWAYPRGRAVRDEKSPSTIAGATGVACCLGADFVKVNYPKKEGMESKEIFKEVVKAAGRTKVICAGGSSMDPTSFLQTLQDQLDAGAMGNATGRNIHQRGLDEAVRMCNAIYAVTVERKSVAEAMEIYKGK